MVSEVNSTLITFARVRSLRFLFSQWRHILRMGPVLWYSRVYLITLEDQVLICLAFDFFISCFRSHAIKQF